MTETEAKKVDLRKQLRCLYGPTAKQVVEVDVPEMRFLVAEGEGDPNTSEAFKHAVEALFALSYALKFAIRKEAGVDYSVMPLEGLWWTDGQKRSFAELQADKDDWKWKLMMVQPERVDRDLYGRTLASVARKKKLPGLRGVRLEAFREGRVAQILHVGPFSEEGPTIERLDRFIEERGGSMRGGHHEIYLSDFRRTAPERLKTVIRHPF
ncbi:MAG: GyrI-like domain-containing protein [Rubrobacter sp.]